MIRSAPATRSMTALIATLAMLFAQAACAQDGSAPVAPVQTGLEQPGAKPLRQAKMADLGGESASADVRHIADWAVDSGDNKGLPFVVIDKVDGRVFIFQADGRLRGASPALIGSARGDHSVPGIGSRKISAILPEERTTPAGRFEAQMGKGPKGEDLLWVDYDGALAMHRVVTNVPRERRLERLASKVAADRRITYGCINLPAKFFDAVVLPTFGSSLGVVYILPEARRAQELFGSYEVRAGLMPAAGAQAPALH